MIIEQDPFLDVIAEYPGCVIDYCLVRNVQGRGLNAHREALLCASQKLFIDEDGEALWDFDLSKADAIPINPGNLFAPIPKDGLNYRKAFLEPPYPYGYTGADFDKVNAALFPRGTADLEVFQWTTGWSDFFDEGHEWWGALCLTVYDKALDRFAVILAAATD